MNSRTCFFLILLGVLFSGACYAGTIIYVDDDALPGGDGQSWGTAYKYLQDGLMAASTGDEIRVAQGTYKPDQGAGLIPGDRDATFQLKNGVALKGGYAGLGEPDPDARNVGLYETILSGDTNSGENSYHVVTSNGTGGTTVLDGFTILAGNANGDPSSPDSGGGGMYDGNASLTVRDCTFTRNTAGRFGGAMLNADSNVTLTNCTFSENSCA